MERDLHVVFGAGQVGVPLAETLLRAGKRVRLVRRSAGAVPEGAELIRGDAADPNFCAEAALGAAVLYHCMNPPYTSAAWAVLVPLTMKNLITAAGDAGARLVVLDNLYMLGRTGGAPMSETTPMNPCSRKGEIRARAAEHLFEAHRRGEVRAVSGRAADFYGPRGTQTYLGDYFWKPALAGRSVWSPADPDAVHTYHYIPDVAAGLAALGNAADEDLGRAWMLPCRPAGTLRELVTRFSQALGRPIGIRAMPRWVLGAGAVLVPLVRELKEMAYQWDEPFIVDDRRFRERFRLEPAGLEEAARATVEWAKRHYAAKAG